MQRVRDFGGALCLKWMFVSHPSPQGSGIYREEEMGRLYEPEVEVDSREAELSGHSRADVCLNSQTVAACVRPTQVQLDKI